MMIYLKLLATAFFWGGTFIAGRILARSVDPYVAAFLRFAIASVFLMSLIYIKAGRLPGIQMKQSLAIVLLGMTGVFSYNVFFFSGLRTVAAGRAALIIALNPIAISLLSSLLFKEKLTVMKVIGILLSVSGAIIVVTNGNIAGIFANPLGIGELFIFGCVASWVTYTLIGKAILSGLSPLVSVGYSALAGALALFGPAVHQGLFTTIPMLHTNDWLSLVYLGFFGTVLGFIWYYQAINTVGPMKSSVFINFVPVSAIILAFFLLGEPITLSLMTGASLVICGVLLTNFSGYLIRYLKQT